MTVVSIVTALLIAQPSVIESREYHIDRDAGNRVVFYSEAPIEDFEGTTDEIDGYLLVSGISGTPKAGNEFYFEVNLEALDTGIGLRNRHMRDNYLETDRHPYVSFGGTLAKTEMSSDSTLAVTSFGTFDLHGVKREREIEVQVVSLSDGYRVTGEFYVKLEDHDIDIPKLMFLKINQNIRVSIEFYLKKMKKQD